MLCSGTARWAEEVANDTPGALPTRRERAARHQGKRNCRRIGRPRSRSIRRKQGFDSATRTRTVEKRGRKRGRGSWPEPTAPDYISDSERGSPARDSDAAHETGRFGIHQFNDGWAATVTMNRRSTERGQRTVSPWASIESFFGREEARRWIGGRAFGFWRAGGPSGEARHGSD